MFNTEKSGYNKKEVDNFIIKQKAELNSIISDLRAQNIELKSEIEDLSIQLKSFKEQEDSIKDAMILAAKKNREIEEQASREYRIECEKVKKLYYKWADTVEAVRKKYGLINTDELNTRKFYLDIENLFDNNQINPNLNINKFENNSETTKTLPSIDEQKIHHKELLSRMSGLLHSVSSSVRQAEIRKYSQFKQDDNKNINNVILEPKKTENIANFGEEEFNKETERLKKVENNNEDNIEKIETEKYKPLVPISEGLQGFANLLDKYLSTDEEDMGAYGKVITNSHEANLSKKTTALNNNNEKSENEFSKKLNIPYGDLTHGTNGFNLQEAVNPKESLEEIMQSFDL